MGCVNETQLQVDENVYYTTQVGATDVEQSGNMCHNNTNIVFYKVKLTVRLTQKVSLQLNRATRTGSSGLACQHAALCSVCHGVSQDRDFY